MQSVITAPEQIAEHWPVLGPRLEAALRNTYGGPDLVGIAEGLKAGELLNIRIGERADAVVEFHQLEDEKICHVVALAGEDMHRWLNELYVVLTALAREQGCHSITLNGRLGWKRALRRFGFRHVQTFYRMPLQG